MKVVMRKKYKTKGGVPVKIITTSLGHPSTTVYRVAGFVRLDSNVHIWNWTSSGEFYTGCSDERDLVEVE